MDLHLVRHGPPLIQPGRPASTWALDTSRTADIEQLGHVLRRRAPTAVWHSSDEPKAIATAHLMTPGRVAAWATLREAHRSDWFANRGEFQAAVREAFDHPARAARPGWEPLDDTRRRVSAFVAALVALVATVMVLVGHGTAWTLLVSHLTRQPPDLSAWDHLTAPDLCTIDLDTRSIEHRWGSWAGRPKLQVPVRPAPADRSGTRTGSAPP